MRISDWSSDVCSSDLDDGGNLTALAGTRAVAKEESGPVRATVLVRRERQPFLGRLEQTGDVALERSEEHTSELQSLMRISYAVFCLKKKNKIVHIINRPDNNTNQQLQPNSLQHHRNTEKHK